jgi:hypothetical protein
LQHTQIGAISAPSKEKVIIKISSGDESSEHEVTRKDLKLTVSKKRSLSNATVTSPGGPPKKRQITVPVIELLDSDDEYSKATSTIESLTTAMSLKPASNPSQPERMAAVKVEQGLSHGHEKVASGESSSDRSVDNAMRDKDGRFILTQKVKVDFIEKLTEVPARWPIPPDDGTNTAYVIDLNNDKKWRELDVNSKKKRLDRFVKQEVCLTSFSCGST